MTLRSSLVLLSLSFCASAFAADYPVSSAAQLTSTLASVQAGDTVILADGTYDLNASPNCSAAGTASARITVRAANPLGAKIRFNTLEGFKVSGPYWTFDGLDVEGICANDSDCEHAFHVTGKATHFALRNSRVRDFNAQLKVNAAFINNVWEIPSYGLIENNDVGDTRARNTSNPVTKLNIDTGVDWVVRGNHLHDFQKNGGDFISYGSFMKSGSVHGTYERNLVICTESAPAGCTRIGLSFGGGGTANQYCAPAFDAGVACDPEHTDGVMRNNLIVNCSDVGIYLNKAANTRVLFNTLVSTNGVDYRFTSTTGEAHGNVLTSVVRARNGGTFTAGTNLQNVTEATFTGWYQAPLMGDFRLKGDVSSLIGAAAPRALVTDDYCGRARPASGSYTLGALEHALGDCAVSALDAGTPDGGSNGSDDGGISGGDDAGTETDAGVVSGEDAGVNGDGSGETSGGCSCSAIGVPAVMLSALALVVRRRRRTR